MDLDLARPDAVQPDVRDGSGVRDGSVSSG
jgi:hypothetical protein